ncbi:FkbM family methyltransferase [Candidatus Dependentiae bacterium]|nr:FkbM family methyltransferase [Candidatus Dependentiae bacterium]
MKNKYLFFKLCAALIPWLPAKGTVFNFSDPKETLPYVLQFMPTEPIIVEAGSFDGNDSVFLATRVPNAKVHSFEPVPELYKKVKIATQNFKNIFTYELALSDKNGEAIFHVSELTYQQGTASASSSLLPPNQYLLNTTPLVFPRKITVRTATLDTWAQENGISHVDLLWLDMQGYELNMLKGSPNILKTVKAILTEVEFVAGYEGQYLYEDVKNFLESEGFELKGLNTAPKWYGDALFIRP